ncbi:FAD-binding oxidoreductase [Prolixibacteraceae bacterium Z1-6]|uniref:FAD-binding oxidoreductase n=1 Tax=Draconibacterium aestuarii TaxID=2998507 RepID=A0A9X3FGF5_9BACT|nr:FAD-binding oxidoreductase [Prolixibacteraceae bacterium Z1-6]
MTINMNPEIQLDTNYYKVIGIRNLSEHTFVLSLPKSRFKFEAGQHVSLSISGDYQSREYSIYSAEEDENLEVLVKEVDGGYFSPKLKHLKIGDMVEVHGPFGKFGLDQKNKESNKHVFIASGTGIAPFHSIIKSTPNLDYHLIHGVRTIEEGYEREEYDADRLTLCTSRDKRGDFHGRLTEYLKKTNFDKNTCFYLCGNSDMIFDSMEILSDKGFGRENITVEVYF